MGRTGKVYSFTKVRKKRTQSGFVALAIGIESLAVLALLICYGIYKAGQMVGAICYLPYVSFIACVICAIKTNIDRERIDVSGKYLVLGHRLCVVSAILHAFIFFVGIYQIIM